MFYLFNRLSTLHAFNLFSSTQKLCEKKIKHKKYNFLPS